MYDNSLNAQAYRQADLGSMSPEKMIVALYERIFRDLNDACSALDDGELAAYNTLVCHAQSIVTELRASLDHSIGGDIPGNLDALYDFVFHKLLLALADRDKAHLNACRTVLEPLLEAWRQVPAGAGEKEARRRVGNSTGTGVNPATADESADTVDPAAPAETESHICVMV